MSYIWKNLIVDNLWVLGALVGMFAFGIIVNTIHKGLDNLSKEESIAFVASIVVLILMFVLS